MRTVFLAVALPALLLVFPAWRAPASAVPDSSLTFNHQLHMSEDVGAECTTCHAAEESATARDRLLPTMDTCAECHDVEDDDACTMCHPDLDAAGEIDLPAREILFVHQSHLKYEGVSCVTCHEGMARVTETAGHHAPAMGTCSTCHIDGKAPDACEACHTDLAHLKPETHAYGWALEHGRSVRAGDSSCAPCHSEAGCEECHDSAQIPAGKRVVGSLTAFAPQLDGTAGMILKGAHQIDYVFTHPLEARGKDRECALCHETERFCTDCHEEQAGVSPTWHGGPGWGAIAGGVGTGGGRHAEMAKRDMESCAACHGYQGDDPVCVLCHADRTPGKGNDPKTHGPRFKSQAGHGDFHSDPNAICYNCHASGLTGVGRTSGGGPGFCGYCHGVK